jgi:tRNA-binding protein
MRRSASAKQGEGGEQAKHTKHAGILPARWQHREMETISFDGFLAVELRVGRVLRVEAFPEARKPAYVLQVDFGPQIGLRKSTAQITEHYAPEQLVGRLVVACVNLPEKQVGPHRSQCLVTGFHDEQGAVRLCQPDGEVPLGTRLL